ncbi:MAG TPA: hypothetical protein VK731_10745 [Candidatus Cybelea sp.]|nr:hypothetical protein [Candidatus Cybelea sp.]
MSSNLERTVDGSPGLGRYVPLLVLAAALVVVLLLPLKIIGYGFLPPDDALADAAKSITGKTWPEILVLRNDYAIDNHIGWHTLLRQVHLWTKWQDETLVLFSIVTLFTLVGWAGLPWVKRPEAWLISLILVLGIQTPFMRRFMMGRPFMWSILALVTMLFLCQSRGSASPRKADWAVMTGLIALAVLLHGVWYFWALPVAAFFLAQQFRWATALAGSWAAGAVLGAVFTGRPVVYLVEAWRQAWGVIGLHANQSTLATELRPTSGNWFPLLLLGGLAVLRQLANLPSRPWSTQPAFWLLCMGWVLGFQAERFWDDWGLPALMVLMALELDLFLESRLAVATVKRLAVAAGLSVTLWLTTTEDADNRWSAGTGTAYLAENDPVLAGWLPGQGGIFYQTDMEFFYHTFFRNPIAPWRYMAGFEPAFMPADDFVTYQQILANNGDPDAYRPWIRKMRLQDRLVLSATGNPTTFLPELEWKYASGTLWLGRLPRKE